MFIGHTDSKRALGRNLRVEGISSNSACSSRDRSLFTDRLFGGMQSSAGSWHLFCICNSGVDSISLNGVEMGVEGVSSKALTFLKVEPMQFVGFPSSYSEDAGENNSFFPGYLTVDFTRDRSELDSKLGTKVPTSIGLEERADAFWKNLLWK